MFKFLFWLFADNAVLTKYESGTPLEDLYRQVLILNPPDTPFSSGILKNKATGTNHEWLEDSILAATINPVVEGASIAYGTITAPQRVVNYTQIFTRTGQVSSTQQWIAHGGGIKDMNAYQEMKAMKAIAEDLERTLLLGTRNAGGTATARGLGGALNFITTNATAVSSQSLTESFYNGLNELAFDNKGRVDDVYVPMRLKRVISSFTAGATKNINSDDKRLVNSVDVYESDLGIQKIFASRFMPSGDGTSAIIGIESDKWSIADGEPIRKLSKDEIAQTVHGNSFVIRGELTLEARAQSHCFKATGLRDIFVI